MPYEIAVPGRAVLGEGPTWDPDTGRLLWVDIPSCEVHAYDPVTGADTVLRTPQPVGAAKPRAAGGLVVNLRDGVGLYEEDGTFRWLATFPREGVRGNDAAVAPDGALWAGTMREDQSAPDGVLRRIAPDGAAATVVTGVTVSNGIGWSPDGRLMYYVDTPTRRIDVFDCDGPAIRNRRVFVHVPAPGWPDGLTVDALGCVWVALWDGGRILRYTPAGRLDRTIELPAPLTTACAFGGPDLRDLYVTTATVDLPPDAPAPNGAVLVVPDAGEGLPGVPFAG
ncbi:SMP-30/gluconolactonase/LRE family protein [Thermomonospora catenispora]|uniref:SMP-30/gluconolactonase/LRE family protein n=1 Tax=Thermomonospora catenispora TaxID=2493090 RepID=UPI00111D1DAE|nr:SMP-30/gluconolactonase/LRE family protein [Thermomonospora catenispora]TNY35773.1 SMP-30/gluconolactonase/LRE family protein [Thermomonospora catenispora]